MPARTMSRSEVFDAHMSLVETILASEDIRDRLGSHADTLLKECQNAFLPNIRGGIFCLPREQKDSDATAYVPLSLTEAKHKKVIASRGLLAPSLRMVEALAEDSSIAHVLNSYSKTVKFLSPSPVDPVSASVHAHFFNVSGQSTSRLGIGRSVILTPLITRYPGMLEETIVHEFQHAIDNKRTDVDALVLSDSTVEKRDRAGREYRAYRVGHAVLETLGYHESINLGMAAAWSEFELGKTAGWGVSDAAIARAAALGAI